MKKVLIIIFMLTNLRAGAQVTEIISIIRGAVTKVIQALDLEVQRLQNQTIWLQDAEKQIENEMSKLKLDEISEWVQKQKDLYQNYYNELWQVKQAIEDYDKLKKIIQLQANLISEYKIAWSQISQDKNFSSGELQYIYQVYTGIISQSLDNAQRILLVVKAFTTQMSDASRMKLINETENDLQTNYDDLRRFTNFNIKMSLERSAEAGDMQTVKKLYGLP
jgi:hypothetical protein